MELQGGSSGSSDVLGIKALDANDGSCTCGQTSGWKPVFLATSFGLRVIGEKCL